MGTTDSPPTWSTWKEILPVCIYGPYLKRTIRVTLIVGTILVTINQMDVFLSGRATSTVLIKSAVTYLVPFCVSNYGLLVAAREKQRPDR